jgi:hypothetical protein
MSVETGLLERIDRTEQRLTEHRRTAEHHLIEARITLARFKGAYQRSAPSSDVGPGA